MLKEYFDGINDPRQEGKVKHNLLEVIVNKYGREDSATKRCKRAKAHSYGQRMVKQTADGAGTNRY